MLDLSLNIVVVWSQDLVSHLAVSNLRLDGLYPLPISVLVFFTFIEFTFFVRSNVFVNFTDGTLCAHHDLLKFFTLHIFVKNKRKLNFLRKLV